MFSSDIYVTETSNRGRCVVAKRDVPAGTCLLTETPYSIVPFRALIEDNEINLLPTALTSKEKHVIFTIPKNVNIHGCMLASRILNKIADEKLIFHESNISKLCSKKYEATDDKISPILTIIRWLLENELMYSTSNCLTILGIISQNSFTITSAEMRPLGIGLYLQASMFNHNCCPNAHQSFHHDQLLIHTLRDIKRGEEISIAYIDVGKPVWWRRMELLNSYGFICHCIRCTMRDKFDYIRCMDTNCTGECHPTSQLYKSQYRNWLSVSSHQKESTKGLANSVNSSTISSDFNQKTDQFLLLLPYFQLLSEFYPNILVWNLQQHLSGSSSVSGLPVLNEILSDLSFECSRCQRIRSGQSLAIAFAKCISDYNNAVDTYRDNSNNSIYSSKLMAIVQSMQKLIPTSHYSFMELTNQLTLEYIRLSEFAKAANIMNNLGLRSFYTSYPHRSPTIAIQELQLGRLLSYLGDKEARGHLLRALHSIRISHGIKHELFRAVTEAIDMRH